MEEVMHVLQSILTFGGGASSGCRKGRMGKRAHGREAPSPCFNLSGFFALLHVFGFLIRFSCKKAFKVVCVSWRLLTCTPYLRLLGLVNENTWYPIKFKFQINNKIIFVKAHTIYCMGHPHTKNDQLFIWSSNQTQCPVSYQLGLFYS